MPSLGEPEPDFDRTQSEGELDQPPARKYYVDGRRSRSPPRLTTSPDTSTGALRLVEYADYLAGQVRVLCPTIDDLRQRWADPRLPRGARGELASRGVPIEEMSRRLELSRPTLTLSTSLRTQRGTSHNGPGRTRTIGARPTTRATWRY